MTQKEQILKWLTAPQTDYYANFYKYFAAKQYLYKKNITNGNNRINRTDETNRNNETNRTNRKLTQNQMQKVQEATLLTNIFIDGLYKASLNKASLDSLREWAKFAKQNAKFNLPKQTMAKDLLAEWNSRFDDIASGKYNLFTDEMKEHLKIEEEVK